MKDDFGFVHMKGSIQSGTIAAKVFQIPEGYRPSHSLLYAVYSDNGANQVLAYATVTQAGEVYASAGHNSQFCFNNITFRAEY